MLLLAQAYIITQYCYVSYWALVIIGLIPPIPELKSGFIRVYDFDTLVHLN